MYKITVGVDGMACNMCESHVNDAVRKAFAVKSVKSDHKAKRTVIISETPIAEEAIRSALLDYYKRNNIPYDPADFPEPHEAHEEE